MKTSMPLNLYQYSDYRLFLRDLYSQQKASNSGFSYRYLSQKAGINSSAFFKHVIEGERNLSKSTLLKTCMALGLKDGEAEYFENLVFFNQAKSIKEKNLYFDRLTKLRGVYDMRRVAEAQYAFYGKWYHSAIRELISFFPQRGNLKSLAQSLSPAVSAKEVQESVELLHRLGLIFKDAQGRWHRSDPVLTSGNQNGSQLLIDFQLEMLELARQAYRRWPAGSRMMSSTTFAVSEPALELFKKRIRQLRAELLDLARLDERPARVYQLNLNLFPLTNPVAA